MSLPEVESCLAYRGLGALDESAPTFEQYKVTYAKRGPEGWVVEGDLLFEREEDLWLHYRQLYAQGNAAGLSFRSLIPCVTDPSDMSPYDGLERVLNVHRKLNLTYCFGEFQDPELESWVKTAVPIVTAVWERAADVNFIHIEMPAAQCHCGFDNPIAESCTEVSYEAKIRIRQGRDEECPQNPDGSLDCYLGFANLRFPPDFDPNKPNNFQASVRFWTNDIDSYSKLQSVAYHEFGHILGLGHEFSRYTHSDANCALNTDDAWRGVTDPDATSVMGYNYCFNTFSKADAPTVRDRLGLSYLYNLPRYTRTRLEDTLSDDIIWHRPGQTEYEVWQTTPTGNGPIDFTKEAFCYQGSECTEATPEHIKPLPLRADGNHKGAFLFGLEDVEDSLRDHSGIPSITSVVVNKTVDVPLVGRFLGDDDNEEIWWVRPGDQSDSVSEFILNSFTEMPNYGVGVATSDYFRPLTGLWAPQLGAGTPGSQVLWYRESSDVGRLVFLNDDFQTTSETTFGSCSGVFGTLGLTGEYLPLLGNFDSDDETEIFWASTQAKPSVLYLEPEALAGVVLPGPAICTSRTRAFVSNTLGKPFVGDFNGDGKDDIFWYRTGGVANNDVLWLFRDNATVASKSMNQIEDFSPVVGDFNGDDCDDILWYAPHRTYRAEPSDDPTAGDGLHVIQGTSPVWRSICNSTGQDNPNLFQGFVEDQGQEVPLDSYPVGFNPRIGKWAR